MPAAGHAPVSALYRDGAHLRCRSLATQARTAQLALPAPPPRLLADWQRETRQRLALEPGDVEELPLARARLRWPDYQRCVQAMADWIRTLGLADGLPHCDVALMACRGAPYHHDAVQYGSKAFCNLFLSDDCGLDLHFPATGQRIPLGRGTAVLFDTAQPHAVIDRHGHHFDPADFPPGADRTQVFLTWELPLAHGGVAQALGIQLDTAPAMPLTEDAALPGPHGHAACLCPQTGAWRPLEPE